MAADSSCRALASPRREREGLAPSKPRVLFGLSQQKGSAMMKLNTKALTTALAYAPTRFKEAVRDASSVFFRRARKVDAQSAATFALAAVMLSAAASPAFAQTAGGGGDITTFLQNLVNLLTGTAGKLIAVLAICIVGIGALMGALSMRAAGSVVLGVLMIFSASWIVNQIIGQ